MQRTDCQIKTLIRGGRPHDYRDHLTHLLSRAEIEFHPDRPTDQAIHPLLGLRRFGPYSAGLVPDPINIATISPSGDSNRLFDFMKKLAMSHTPVERKGYLPTWPGFKELFNVRMVGAAKDLSPRIG